MNLLDFVACDVINAICFVIIAGWQVSIPACKPFNYAVLESFHPVNPFSHISKSITRGVSK
jgi:hypothetical protein